MSVKLSPNSSHHHTHWLWALFFFLVCFGSKIILIAIYFFFIQSVSTFDDVTRQFHRTFNSWHNEISPGKKIYIFIQFISKIFGFYSISLQCRCFLFSFLLSVACRFYAHFHCLLYRSPRFSYFFRCGLLFLFSASPIRTRYDWKTRREQKKHILKVISKSWCDWTRITSQSIRIKCKKREKKSLFKELFNKL